MLDRLPTPHKGLANARSSLYASPEYLFYLLQGINSPLEFTGRAHCYWRPVSVRMAWDLAVSHSQSKACLCLNVNRCVEKWYIYFCYENVVIDSCLVSPIADLAHHFLLSAGAVPRESTVSPNFFSISCVNAGGWYKCQRAWFASGMILSSVCWTPITFHPCEWDCQARDKKISGSKAYQKLFWIPWIPTCLDRLMEQWQRRVCSSAHGVPCWTTRGESL